MISEEERQEIAAALPGASSDATANGNKEAAASESLAKTITKPMRLSARNSPFRSTGTSNITVTVDGQRQTLSIPIRSVPILIERRIRAETIETVRAPEAGKTLDQETMRYVVVYDDNNPDYLVRLADQLNLFLKRMVLEGLNCEIEDAEDNLLWSLDPQGVRDWEAALNELEASGWTGEQLGKLREDISALTMTREQLEERDRRKRS